MSNTSYLRKRSVKDQERHQRELRSTSAKIFPICIIVDTSHSMRMYRDRQYKTRIDRVNEGIQQFLKDIREDDRLADSVEIAIVTFDDRADLFLPFSTVNEIQNITITASAHSGDTPRGVELALRAIDAEKTLLRESGKPHHAPWMVIMSDGRATPDAGAVRPGTNTKDYTDINRRLTQVQKKTKLLESQKQLEIIPVLISEKTDHQYAVALKQMQDFTNTERCRDIANGKDISAFFKELSHSVSVGSVEFALTNDGAISSHSAPGASNVLAGLRYEPLRYVPHDEPTSDPETEALDESEEMLSNQTPPVASSYETEADNSITKEEIEQVERLEREAKQAQSYEEVELSSELEETETAETMPEEPPLVIEEEESTQPSSPGIPLDEAALEMHLAKIVDWDDI